MSVRVVWRLIDGFDKIRIAARSLSVSSMTTNNEVNLKCCGFYQHLVITSLGYFEKKFHPLEKKGK